LIEAVEAMVKLETVVEPDGLVGAYRVGYERFRAEMVRRGYCS
jgi:hypothetical protein